MGYNTNFYVTIENERELPEDTLEYLTLVLENEGIGVAQHFSQKWYNWEEDMVRLSKKFPLAKFVITGNGEEDEDIWRAYVFGGKIQVEKAEILYKHCILW